MVVDLELEPFQEKCLAISRMGTRQSKEVERLVFVLPLKPALAGPYQGIAKTMSSIETHRLHVAGRNDRRLLRKMEV